MATLAQNIQRAIDDFNSIENAIVQKGVPVPDGTPTSEYGEKILSIETGVDTSGDTVVPSALREGYTAHDAAGQEITGTIPNYGGAITEGAVPGAQAKYEEGVADGKQAEYDAFWDSYQLNGGRDYDYDFAFAGAGWGNALFKPKYPMKPLRVQYMFSSSTISGDLAQILEDCGVSLDTSRAVHTTNAFSNARRITRVPPISLLSATGSVALFQYCSALETIDSIVASSAVTWFVYCFQSCGALANLTIEGTIGQNGFNVSWSPLSKASLTSIVNALSATTTGLTVTLRKAAVDTAFETAQGSADGSSSEEWLNLIATKSNWTINLINS